MGRTADDVGVIDRRLFLHLASLLGQWPPLCPFQVVGSGRRRRPAWDGLARPALAVASPEGAVLSVAPDRVEEVRALAARTGAAALPADSGPVDRLLAELPTLVGFPTWVARRAVFRWTTEPAPLPPVGEWVPSTLPGLPVWLRRFTGEVLVARDAGGGYLAGVGIKRHDTYGRELAVGTVERARGQGLARRLVAQAARRVLAEAAVPTYLHDPANVASARVAQAAGFTERGWWSYGVFPE